VKKGARRMFKLALNAGHYKYTAGKRCHSDLDPKQTREWVLNDRICDKIEKILAEYDGIEVLRIDDTTGEKDVSLANRTKKANDWGADFYLAIHHNAAGFKFKGGGIVAYVYTKPSAKALEWQKALYNASVKGTGLFGNRSTPLAQKNLHEVRETKMPAVLMECGFMDSTVDVPIILSENFANNISEAFAKVIIEKSGATKKVAKAPTHYRVEVAFETKSKADGFADKLKKEGYTPILVEAEGEYEEPKVEVPKEEPKVEPVKEIKVGSNVKVKSGAKTYTGGGLASFVYTRVHQVKEIKGDRAVITYGGVTVCAIHKDNLVLV
jgi:N-acetylmuramoyl-L-alanine amidase